MLEENTEPPRKLIRRLQKFTRHKNIMFTDRCNSAIFIAMQIAKRVNPRQSILIPDQGGWLSYKKYPKFFNFNIREIKTDYGIIDLEDLEEQSKNASALIFTSFAGYFAEQPLKKIAKVCHENNCMVIEDASGAIGHPKLCNGKYSDIIVGSFGHWKPIDYGYGGFISTKDPKAFSYAREAISMVKVHPIFYDDIYKELKDKKLKLIMHLAEKVKKDLKKFDIIHRNKKGLNVVAKFDPKVIDYCTKKNYPYMLCPNYIRVNEKAISIELKRLTMEQLEK